MERVNKAVAILKKYKASLLSDTCETVIATDKNQKVCAYEEEDLCKKLEADLQNITEENVALKIKFNAAMNDKERTTEVMGKLRALNQELEQENSDMLSQIVTNSDLIASLKQDKQKLYEIVTIHEERHNISNDAHKSVITALKKKNQELSEAIADENALKNEIPAHKLRQGKDIERLKAANEYLMQEDMKFMEQIKRMTAEKETKMIQMKEENEMIILELENDLEEKEPNVEILKELSNYETELK